MLVINHLKAEATRQREWDRNPVVAADCLFAKHRAKSCDAWVARLAGLSDEAALQQLIAHRDGQEMDMRSGYSVLASHSEMTWFEGVVDAIYREKRGWIEVMDYGYDGAKKKNLNLPMYRRMLGINHCTGSIVRERSETDEAWAQRRREWLGRYHPDVPVRDSHARWHPGGKTTEIRLGTVATFMEQEHTVEAGIRHLSGTDEGQGRVFEFVEVFMAPKTKALATVRQVAGEPVPLGPRELARYPVEVIA